MLTAAAQESAHMASEGSCFEESRTHPSIGPIRPRSAGRRGQRRRCTMPSTQYASCCDKRKPASRRGAEEHTAAQMASGRVLLGPRARSEETSGCLRCRREPALSRQREVQLRKHLKLRASEKALIASTVTDELIDK
ncbi:hypothetical protein PsYK624_136140 [Phanerochaete sordida]|uniref:Uncharacterized protein n=1 Tax=Phanerochaete sordida TaxID=48140 RepID=A0A9P3GLA0_9APHY|nr:hypothetical protein PsYK624_136140 [Phanerochaete sordida]